MCKAKPLHSVDVQNQLFCTSNVMLQNCLFSTAFHSSKTMVFMLLLMGINYVDIIHSQKF